MGSRQGPEAGGCSAILSIESQDAEERYRTEPVEHVTPEIVFERRWASRPTAGTWQETVGTARRESGTWARNTTDGRFLQWTLVGCRWRVTMRCLDRSASANRANSDAPNPHWGLQQRSIGLLRTSAAGVPNGGTPRPAAEVRYGAAPSLTPSWYPLDTFSSHGSFFALCLIRINTIQTQNPKPSISTPEHALPPHLDPTRPGRP